MESVPTTPKAGSLGNRFPADGARLVCKDDPCLGSRRNLRRCGNHGNRIEEVAEDIAREIDIHHQGVRLCGALHKHAEDLESHPRVPQLCRNDVVACLSFEESHGPIEGAFCLKNLTQHVEHGVFVFEVTHIYERHTTRKWF
jgi:hypothetical protein